MRVEDLAASYESRSRLYCGGTVPAVRVVLSAGGEGTGTYAAQVALLTAASLLGRMFGDVHLDVPDVAMHPALFSGATLRAALENELRRARPPELRGPAVARTDSRTLRVRWEEGSADVVFAGFGWQARVGTSRSAIEIPQTANPFGPAMAAVLAAAETFRLALDSKHSVRTANINLWTWDNEGTAEPSWAPNLSIGEIWTVGAGSVGTAALHFLTLATSNYTVALIDRDNIGLHNISRSPIFTPDDVGFAKVDITAAYLRERGIEVVGGEKAWLGESSLWSRRPQGRPDLLLSTANEHHVRWDIEAMYPPVQIHASTGRSWQATAFRHIPLVDACSLCVFPDSGIEAPPICATGEIRDLHTQERSDAALPFLSYSAGLMVAIEIWKLAQGVIRPMPSNKVYLQSAGDPLIVSLPLMRQHGCQCLTRSASAHRDAIAGSRYARLSVTGSR